MQLALKRPTGMAAFNVFWFGQFVSLIGSGMSQFALGIWAWQVTGSATALALITVFATGPALFISPLAGALVDRWPRRTTLIVSDAASAVATLAILLLYVADLLQIWHLYVAAVWVGIFQSLQWPAYSAAITLLMTKEHYGRANGMMGLANAGAIVGAPIFAGVLLGIVGIGGVLAVDLVTFLIAMVTLLLITIPSLPRTVDPLAKPSILREALEGFRYILTRPSLIGMQLTFFVSNLLFAFTFGMISPYILARSGDDAQALATTMSAFGVGGVLGGIAMSAWGGPKRRIHGLLGGMALGYLFVGPLTGISQSVWLWAACAFATGALLPIIDGSSQAIWQSKVDPAIQGRVFAVRRMIAQASFPVGLITAATLADRVLEPAMQPGGALAPLFGPLVGVGPGAGMGLMFVVAGSVGILTAAVAYTIPFIRDVETILPDHQHTVEPAEAAVQSA
jgi:MFS transporter, DHA3 family, macrolide efflux protein